MPCVITDIYGSRSSTGTLTGKANVNIYAVPSSNALTFSYTGTFRPATAINPLITGPGAYQRGVVVTTDAGGNFSITLPYLATETHPTTGVKWTIVFPDGQGVMGEVPSVAGPLKIDDLIQTYSWAWVSQVYVAPVTAGVLARGTTTFTGASDTASIVFGSAFASAAYQVKLAASYDSGTNGIAWFTNKSTTGFDIKVSDSAFVGTVDWEVVL